jgi:hypothetical protein
MSDNTPSLEPIGGSPLTEADPNSLNELIQERITDLFNKKPISVSDADLIQMVEYYRRERVRFKAESLAKEQKEPKPRGAKRATPKSVVEALASAEELF